MLKKHILGVAVLYVIFLIGCSSGGTTNGTTGDILVSSSASSGVVNVNVNAFRFGFEPKTITVKQGQTVRLTAESVDVPHGLAISEYGVSIYLDGLRSQTVEFVAERVGKFPVYCSVPCGSEHSTMQGILIVE